MISNYAIIQCTVQCVVAGVSTGNTQTSSPRPAWSLCFTTRDFPHWSERCTVSSTTLQNTCWRRWSWWMTSAIKVRSQGACVCVSSMPVCLVHGALNKWMGQQWMRGQQNACMICTFGVCRTLGWSAHLGSAECLHDLHIWGLQNAWVIRTFGVWRMLGWSAHLGSAERLDDPHIWGLQNAWMIHTFGGLSLCLVWRTVFWSTGL